MFFYYRQTKTKDNKIGIFSLFEIFDCYTIMAMINKKKFNNIEKRATNIDVVQGVKKNTNQFGSFFMELMTGIEPVTSTLPEWCSTD